MMKQAGQPAIQFFCSRLGILRNCYVFATDELLLEGHHVEFDFKAFLN
jgi:hypothetical protein